MRWFGDKPSSVPRVGSHIPVHDSTIIPLGPTLLQGSSDLTRNLQASRFYFCTKIFEKTFQLNLKTFAKNISDCSEMDSLFDLASRASLAVFTPTAPLTFSRSRKSDHHFGHSLCSTVPYLTVEGHYPRRCSVKLGLSSPFKTCVLSAAIVC